MFGRNRKVRILVPGTPVVIVEDASHKKETEEALRQNVAAEASGNIDKTVADSFPASDPASSVPETRETPKQRADEKKVA
jgi:hypothetical protein